MPAETPSESPDADLEELVFLCLERIEEDGEAAIEAVCIAHPGLAPELRSRLDTLRAAGLLKTEAGTEDELPERFGEFRVLKRLGAGGMGIVLLAEQESLERKVALKLVRPERLYSPAVRARFRREIEVVSRLAHPGIVPVYSAGEERGVPYFVMEYVEGTALDRALGIVSKISLSGVVGEDLQRAVLKGMRGDETGQEQHESSPVFAGTWVQTCLRIVRQVAEALEHAHRRGILHRDIKPSNIVLTPGGRAMLLDFGLAVREGAERLTRTGAELGSLPYMAPERMGQGSDSGVQEDVYALGVLLYEMLALRLPYEGGSSVEILRRMQAGSPPALRRVNSSVPQDCETVCLVAMDHDPERRYGSADAMARDLTHVLEGQPIEARRASWARRSWMWSRRNPAAALAWGLGALILVGGPLVYGEQQRKALKRIEGINTTLTAANVRIENQNTALEVALAETERQRARAGRHFGRAVGSIRYLTDVAIDELIDVPQAGEAQRKMLQGALTFFTQFLEEVEAGDLESRALRLEVARAHQLTADIQLHMGETDVGEARLRSAVDGFRTLAEESDDLDARTSYASALGDLGRLHRLRGDLTLAHETMERAIDMLQACLDQWPGRETLLIELQRLIEADASVLSDRGELEPAREALEESVAILDELITGDGGNAGKRFARAKSRNRLGETYRALGLGGKASETFEQVLEALDELLLLSPGRLDYRSQRLSVLTNVGNSAMFAGRLSEARGYYEEAIADGEQLVTEFPSYDNNRHLLAAALINLCAFHGSQGRIDESFPPGFRAEELLQDLVARNPEVTHYSVKLAGVLANLGSAHLSTEQPDLAAEYFGAAHLRAKGALEKLTGSADALESLMMGAVGLGYARAQLEGQEGVVEAFEALMDSSLGPQRLTRAASFACELAPEIDGRADLEEEHRAELSEQVIDCAEGLIELAFDRIEDPGPIRQALRAPEFARLRERPAIAARLAGGQ